MYVGRAGDAHMWSMLDVWPRMPGEKDSKKLDILVKEAVIT